MSQVDTSRRYQHDVYPDTRGRFGTFGGKFVPESLMAALAELEQAYEASLHDEVFQEELQKELHSYVGRQPHCTMYRVSQPQSHPMSKSISNAKTWHTPVPTKSTML